MKSQMHSSGESKTRAKWVKLGGFIACLILLGSVGLFAQRRNYDRDRDRDQGGTPSNAGGNWTVFQSEDRMTAEHRTRLELQADNAGDGDDRARVILYCTDHKLKLADFHPSMRLSRPNWMGWSGPQMRVRVRVDDAHDDHNWNWVNGHFLSMDKGTAREMIGAHLFRIEFRTPDGPRIAEFSPAGLDLRLAHDACGLNPKKP